MNKKNMKSMIDLLISIALTLGIYLFVTHYIYQLYGVKGLSMVPTFQGEERIVINKWKYRFQPPQYKDVIVFHEFVDKRDFVKRVIGLPFDKIKIDQGKVYRNGKELNEGYISELSEMDMNEIEVPKDHVFVLGDNRNRSKDSRQIGPVPIKSIVGRVDLVVFPISEWGIVN